MLNIKTKQSEFISIYPSNQGLKQSLLLTKDEILNLFISIYPSNQGLKHQTNISIQDYLNVYLYLSIKSRIETSRGSLDI